MIKCVIWDLDGVLLDGVFLESAGEPPPASPVLAGVVAELAGRGILQAVASRNPPEAAAHAARVLGHEFAAIRCGWTAKSAAISAILAELDLPADAVAFVDDDALERGEVAYTLPDVLVLSPQDMADAPSWPQFSPPVVTDEGRRRGALYLERRARQEEARAFGGSTEEFLRYSQTEVTLGPARLADLARLHELSVRTHQFNSAGAEVSEAELARLLGSPDYLVVGVRLRDRFGDDGMVGGCVIRTRSPASAHAAESPVTWDVPLLMMSCRAMGRGVIDALLAWICQEASTAGAGQVSLPCVISPRNVPLRIALTGAGFRAGQDEHAPAAAQGQPARIAVYRRALDQALPDLPAWLTGLRA